MFSPRSTKKTIFAFISIFSIFGYGFFVFAAAPSGGYTPGSTLDPDCAPGDTDCIVQVSLSGSGLLTADNGLTVTGSNVQLGGGLLQSTQIKQNGNDFFFTGGNVGVGTSTPQFTLDVGGNSQYDFSGTSFSGTLDDLSVDTSNYFGSTSVTYSVYVSSVSDPDEISWTDDRGNSGRFQLYGNSYPLSYGVIATFSNLTGHTGDENWTFSITKTDGGILNVSEQVNIGGNFFATQNKNSSTFIGSGVEVLGNISSAFFVGNGAGFNATGADFSNFIGYGTGSNATGAYNSNFIGYLAGIDATYAYNSNFFGNYAGGSSANAYDANFLGSYAGYSINDGAYSNFFGTNAGYKAGDVNRSNFFGYNAGTNANGSSNANFFGVSAGGGAINAFQSNFIGENAGSLSNGASNSNFFGYNAGAGDKFPVNSSNANFIGTEAGFNADQTSFSNFVGYRAGQQARNAALSTFIGYNSGGQATNASNSIFIGNNAGYTDSVDNYNTGGWSILIGDNTNTNGFSGSIALGANAVNTAPNQFMLADTITQARLGGVEYAFPLTQANPGDVLTNDGAGNLTWAPGGGGGSAWSLLGNAGTDPKTNFIGTTDDTAFVMRTNNIERARILSNGNFGINTDGATATLEVRGAAGFASGYIDSVTYSGSGLDDMTASGTYIGADSCTMNVNINSVSPDNGFSNDTFTWQYVSGPCSGGGGPIEITPGVSQDLTDGIVVTFASGTGHENKAGWDISVIYGFTRPDVLSVISSGNNNFFKIKSDGVWNVNDVLYSMPTIQASNPGDVLTNDGSGNLVWAAPGALTVNVTNGLQFVGGDIGLGGLLTQNTEIDGDNNSKNLSIVLPNYFEVTKANYINFQAFQDINISGKNISLDSRSGKLVFRTPAIENALATNGQVLTLIDATTGETEWQNASGGGSGGLQWYAENAAAPSVTPVATGLGSIALGDGAEALASDMFVYGYTAGEGATDASNSNFIGTAAGRDAINAANSNFFGKSAGLSATTAQYSNFFGEYAGSGATSASNSNFFGQTAGEGSVNAANSIFIGTKAGQSDTVNNTAIYDDSTTFANTSILIGHKTSTGGFSNSIALGAYATNTGINQLQIGSTNRVIRSVFIGDSKGTASINDTFFVGRGAGINATNASFSIFLGQNAGTNATGASGSSFIGRVAGANATNASNSNFIGLGAGSGATNASSSNFMGRNAGINATTANEATFIGNNAGRDATNARYSTFLGTGAGFGAINASNSIIIGAGAGQDSTLNNTNNGFDYSIIIGAAASAGGFSNSIALGSNAINTTSNQFMIGSTTRTIDTTVWKGSAGTECTLTTGTGVSCTSDERLKTNITDLTTDTLDKLLNLKTVTYNWLENPTSKTQIGFLAQDLEQYFPELVATNGEGKKSVYYSQMTPILVEAIREMNLKIVTINDMETPNTWRDSLIAWFGNTANGIENFVAGTIKARNQICIDDVCMTKDQLRKVLENNAVQPPTPITIITPGGNNEEVPTPTDTPAPDDSAGGDVPVQPTE